MKYRVIGSNRDTGARMGLEFDAESKAAAERKARQSGMDVTRVEDITDAPLIHTYDSGSRRPARGGAGSGGVARRLLLLIILLALIAAILHYWPSIRPMLGR